jgi:hypothetical protein
VNLLIGTTAGAFSLDDPATPLIAGTRINHLYRNGEEWWALDGKGRVHHDGDIVGTAPDGTAINCVEVGSDTVWIGATEAQLLRLEAGNLVEDQGFANAPGRDGWYTPWGGPPDVRSMAVDAAGSLFVNIHVGGILRYDDPGPTATLDQDADVHQVIAHPSQPELVLAACARGLAQSDNGHDFAFREEGLHAPYCRAVATIGDIVLVSASTGPRTSRGRLYRADLATGPFMPCTEGLPEWFGENLDTHCLAVLGGSAYAGLEDKVWRSDDGGGSWAEAAEGLPRITCLA